MRVLGMCLAGGGLLIAVFFGGAWLGSRFMHSTVPSVGGDAEVVNPESLVAMDSKQAAQRTEFQQRMRALTAQQHAIADMPELAGVHRQVDLRIQSALEAYEADDLGTAQRLLGKAEQDVQEMLQGLDSAYRLALQAAQQAYAAEDAQGAAMHIAQALELQPENVEAQRWQGRIARLPELLAARREAAELQRAGNLREAQAMFARIAELDPDDTEARRHAAQLARELDAKAYDANKVAVQQALAAQQLQAARQALARVVRQAPQHPDTLALQGQVTALARSQGRDRHLTVAERAAAADDWGAALQAFDQARALESNHNQAVRGAELAGRIVAAQQGVDELLAHPHRLGTPAVAAAARASLSDMRALAALSPRLQEGMRALELALEAAQIPVPVRVLSDDRTEIGIRSVGAFGRIRDRVIELPPGDYVFEGKRKGYRSKLVEVAVRSGVPTEVRLVCDERT